MNLSELIEMKMIDSLSFKFQRSLSYIIITLLLGYVAAEEKLAKRKFWVV